MSHEKLMKRALVPAFAVLAVLGAAVAAWALRLESGSSQSPLDEAPRAVATAMARAAPNEAPIAVVNGEPIGSHALRAMLALQPIGEADQVPTAAPERIVDKFVERVLLRQEARRRGLECTDQQTRNFIDSWLQHTPEEGQRQTAKANGVPLERLGTDPRFVAMMRNFCSEWAVRRAIAAEHPDEPLEEAIARAVAELRAKAEVVVDREAIEAVAAEMSAAR